MPETALAADVPLPAPAMGPAAHLPAWLDTWFTRFAPKAAWAFLVLPVVGIGVIVLTAAYLEGTECYSDDCGLIAIPLTILIDFVLVLLLLFSIGTVASNGRHRTGLKNAQFLFQPRLQAAKDWFIRGDIQEAEFERLRTLLEPAVENKTEEAVLDRAAALSRWFGALLIPVLLMAVMATLITLDEMSYYLLGVYLFFVFVLIMIATVVVLVLAFVYASRFGRAHAEGQRNRETTIKHLEDEILRGVNRRRGGTSYPSSSPGASFRPYGR